MPVLTAIDICSIQKFIFSSNKLKNIVDNSIAVEWATAISKNSAFDIVLNKLNYELNKKIEVLLSGGGNLLINFNNIEDANLFNSYYSRVVYDHFPEMKVAIANKQYKDGELVDSIGKIYTDIAIYKNRNLSDNRLLGLGITLNNTSKGQKSDFHFCSNLDAIYSLKDLEKSNIFSFADEFDKLGRTKNNISYLGIVHIDGNSIGDKINKWLQKKKNNNEKDFKVKKEYRSWSEKLKNISNNAIKSVYKKIVDNIDYKGRQMVGLHKHLIFDLYEEEKSGNIILPIRPIIIGGDDITFICDGRLALSLAEVALRVFNSESIPEFDDERMTACAGVAFINTHSPFIRGYELAESLCDNAKKLSREREESECCIDWHIGKIKPFETLSEMRKRQYTNKNRDNFNLTLKPYVLGNSDVELGSWQWLSNSVLGDNGNSLRSEYWLNRKNKIKSLISELKHDSRNQFLEFYNCLKIKEKDEKIDLKLPIGINSDGLTNNTGTALIDAVEIMDIHQILL